MKEMSNEEMRNINGGSVLACSMSLGVTLVSFFMQAYVVTAVASIATAACVLDEVLCQESKRVLQFTNADYNTADYNFRKVSSQICSASCFGRPVEMLPSGWNLKDMAPT